MNTTKQMLICMFFVLTSAVAHGVDRMSEAEKQSKVMELEALLRRHRYDIILREKEKVSSEKRLLSLNGVEEAQLFEGDTLRGRISRCEGWLKYYHKEVAKVEMKLLDLRSRN